MTINQTLVAAGVPISCHYSDLYALVCEESIRIVRSYKYRKMVTIFISQIDGKPWYDIPFACDKYWLQKEKQ